MLENERTLRLMARTERIAAIYPFFTTKPQRPQRGARYGPLLCVLCAFVVSIFLCFLRRELRLGFRDRALERGLGVGLELLRLADLLRDARVLLGRERDEALLERLH